jgi:HPt (histidine-containing phosphotransfer) domain-containing protein
MNGHLAKPIDPAQMKAQIEKVIRGKLDNPVIVEDDGRGDDTFTPVHETILPIDEPQPVIEDDTPILPGQMDQEMAHPVPHDIEMPDEPVDDLMENPITPDRAPIMQAALQDDDSMLDLTITEDELDEDSFVQALDATAATELDDDFFDDDFDDIMARTEELPPPQPMDGTIVFDSTLLDGLKGSMDQASLSEMMTGLMEKVDEIITHTHGAMNTQDMDTIRARMHELKGMAGNFGLQELSLIAEHAEKAVKEGQVDALPDVLSALPAAGMRAHKVVGEWLQN